MLDKIQIIKTFELNEVSAVDKIILLNTILHYLYIKYLGNNDGTVTLVL